MSPATGNPGFGNWAITPRVLFGGAIAMLAAPAEKSVAKLTNVAWKQHDFEDGETSFIEGGNEGGARVSGN